MKQLHLQYSQEHPTSDHIRGIRVLGFVSTERFMESAKPFKSATEKHNIKKHLSLWGAVCDWKNANRILRPKVGVSLVVYANVKATAKWLDYYIGRTIVLTDELKLREDNSDPTKISPELNCAFSPRPCARDSNFFKNFGHEHVNAPFAPHRIMSHDLPVPAVGYFAF